MNEKAAIKKKMVILFLLVFQISEGFSLKSEINFNWDYNSLNTASDVKYLSPFEKEIILEINKLRSDPGSYAEDYMTPLRKYYKNKLLFYPGDHPLMTTEGISALNECIRYLKKQQPLPLLYPVEGLCKAAHAHVKDQSHSGKTGHAGSDHSNVKERIERYGRWNVRIAENIAYGKLSVQQVIIYLLIDDGVRSRGHRKNFLNPDFQVVGVAAGNHPRFNNMYVMDFAGSFIDE